MAGRAQRLATLRTRLLGFDYGEPVGSESLELVERLFGDLVSTTEVYQQLHEREEQLSQELGLAQAQLFPLRKDNARLLRENNELHRDAIGQAEACDAKLRDLTVENKRVYAQLNEMRLLQKQTEEKIATKGEEVELLQAKLQAFSEAFDGVDADADQPLLESSSGRAAEAFKLVGRHQPRSKGTAMMQITTPLAAQTGSSRADQNPAGNEEDDTHIMSTGDGADSSLTLLVTLQAQIADLKQRLATSEEAKGLAQAAVEVREREIKRLGLVLEQGRDYGAMSTDHAHEANRKIIDQLNNQVDFLNHQLAVHEERTAVYDKQQETLERAVAESNASTEKVQAALAENSALRAATARAELAAEKSQQRLIDLQEEVSSLPSAPLSLSYGKVGEAGSAVSGTNVNDENAGLHTAALQERIVTLQRQLSESSARGDDQARSASAAFDEMNRLRLENEALKRLGEDTRTKLAEAAKSAGHDDLLRALEAQRDSMRVQADASRSVAEQAKRELAALREDESVGKARLTAANDERRRLAAYVETLERRLGEQTSDGLASVAETEALRRAVAAATSGSAAMAAAGDEAMVKLVHEVAVSEGRAEEIARLAEDLANAKATVADLEKELNTVKELLLESDRARGNMSGRLAAAVGLPQALQGLTEELKTALQGKKDLEVEGERLRAEQQQAMSAAARAKTEADAKARALQACSNANDEFAGKNDQLCDELETQKMALRVAQEELRALKLGRAEMSDAHLATSTSLVSMEATLAAQRSELEALRSQRDAVTAASKQCQGELANARRELALAQDLSQGFETRSAHAAEHLETLTTELSLTRSRLAEVEGLCRQRGADLDESQGGLAQIKAQRDSALAAVEALEEKQEQARRLAVRAEQSRVRLVERLDEMTQNEAAQSEVQADWQQEKRRLSDALDTSRQSEANLRAAVAALDLERDAAATAADEAAEAATEAAAGRDDAETRLSELTRQTAEERAQASAFVNTLAQRDRELKTARSAAATAAKDVAKLKRLLTARMDELRTAADDLGMMTRENQAVHTELAELASFRDQASTRMRAAEEGRIAAEQRAKMAEAERGDILSNYKKVCAELTGAESRMHELNHSRQTLARELSECQSEVSRLASALQAAETQLQRRSLDIAALERQIENISSSHRGVERKLEAADDEARRALADVAAQRSASGNANAELERWQRASAAAAEEASAMRARLSVLEAERTQMHRTMLQEKQHSSELEQIIQTTRMRQSATEGRVQQLVEQKAALESRLFREDDPERANSNTRNFVGNSTATAPSAAPSPKLSSSASSSVSEARRAPPLHTVDTGIRHGSSAAEDDGGISDLTAR